MTLSLEEGISLAELDLAGRNHSMPLEALRDPVTPVGLHYLLTHFDIPFVDPRQYQLAVGGRVRRPLTLTLDELRARPAVTVTVTMECAGNGRALLSPRPVSQPWLRGAVGTAEWTGTPLAPLLEEAGVGADAVDVVFSGLDRGVQGEVEQVYERSLSLADALRPEVMLTYAMNGQALLPQHGFPLRLTVPGWYGMAHVKWLGSIALIDRPFEGYQQVQAYRLRASLDEPGLPVTRIRPRSLMIPPGIPDFLTRVRTVEAGVHVLQGRAWSGWSPIAGVEASVDGGRRWARAELEPPASAFAWTGWRYAWDAQPGSYTLCSRATDEAGNTQSVEPVWNMEGMMNNAVQRLEVMVR
jgi:DMSO/TMAO reductase YedYZ molybdopterin-dependent catalytic subunit